MWKAKDDYSNYPKQKWCDYDYVANWIISTGYIPKTSIENLVQMVVTYYESEIYDREEPRKYYTDITESENGGGWMISTKDLAAYVYDSGGLSEFDFEC